MPKSSQLDSPNIHPAVGQRILDAVKNHAWFTEMPSHLSTPLLAGATIRPFSQSQPIHTAGEDPKWIYCVISGMVMMTGCTPSGKLTIPFTIEARNWFGLCEAFNRKPYPLSAIAGSDCTILQVRLDAVHALAKSHPDIWQFIGRILGRQTQKLANNLAELIYLPAPAKIARRLLALSLQDGGVWGNCHLRAINISHDQLGAMLSISRQIVSKILKCFEKEGLITCGYKCVTIENSELLKQKSEFLTNGYSCE